MGAAGRGGLGVAEPTRRTRLCLARPPPAVHFSTFSGVHIPSRPARRASQTSHVGAFRRDRLAQGRSHSVGRWPSDYAVCLHGCSAGLGVRTAGAGRESPVPKLHSQQGLLGITKVYDDPGTIQSRSFGTHTSLRTSASSTAPGMWKPMNRHTHLAVAGAARTLSGLQSDDRVDVQVSYGHQAAVRMN